MYLAQNRYQSIRKKQARSVRVMLPICQFICSFCLFSAQRSEHETTHVAVNLQPSKMVDRVLSPCLQTAMVVMLTLRHYSRTSKSSDRNVSEGKKLHVLPFHFVTLWKSNFIIRVGHVKGEEHEVSLPHHSTGNQDDRY